MSNAKWTSRCKSGYEFNGKVCKRFTSRHELMCADCLTAEIIPAAQRVGVLVRVASAVAALFS